MSNFIAELLDEVRALIDAMDRLDEAYGKRYGLNRSDSHCLELLERHGPMRPKDLAAALGYTTGGVSTVINRLETGGFIERRAAIDDQRAIWAIPIRSIHRDQVQTLIGRIEARTVDISDADLELIADWLKVLRQTVRAYRYRIGPEV